MTILAIVPSLTGGDINGPGLSDGGTKNTLRGFPDGNFNMTYDGIPFGDTNGPTHHNISYFPASTIGSIDVDRGPGNAGNLGANTYGGTIKLYSEGLTDDMHAKARRKLWQLRHRARYSERSDAAISTRAASARSACMANMQYLHSDGALTGQDLYTNNELLKIEDQLDAHWTITLFANQSFLKENLDDNNGATPAQIVVYGKNFALQNTNPTLPTYYALQFHVQAHRYGLCARGRRSALRLQARQHGLHLRLLEPHVQPDNQTQTLCDINNGTSAGQLRPRPTPNANRAASP